MTRTVEIRFKVIRNGGDFCELYAMPDSSPQLRMDDAGEIKTSLHGDFIPAEGVNWLSDEIRPELWIDGEAFPLGVFLPATVKEQEDETQRYLSVDAYDHCWRVQDTRTASLLRIAAGTKYIDAVQALLVEAGVRTAAITPSSATLPEDREGWELGTSYLDIINQLLSEINYNSLWFNNQGAAVLEPSVTPSARYIDHTLDSEEVESLLIPAFAKETDAFQAPNVFICVCSNPDKDEPLVATSENTNPTSPLSIARRGRRICALETVENIASQADLQTYADRLRDQSQFTGETITVQTGLLPGFGVADVTALHSGELAAICIERGWTMDLVTGGTMTHRLERVVVEYG